MEVSGKSDSDLRSEVVQFEPIRCLQGVQNEQSASRKSVQKMSKEPVNVKHTIMHCDTALAYSLFLWVFPAKSSVFCSAYNYIQNNARSNFCHFVTYTCGHLAISTN